MTPPLTAQPFLTVVSGTTSALPWFAAGHWFAERDSMVNHGPPGGNPDVTGTTKLGTSALS